MLEDAIIFELLGVDGEVVEDGLNSVMLGDADLLMAELSLLSNTLIGQLAPGVGFSKEKDAKQSLSVKRVPTSSSSEIR